uniref:Uncharacterized protein n=1 Tax=Poecilia mexicana TaxID=48701 RepID=A0A3B3WN03_9TELE
LFCYQIASCRKPIRGAARRPLVSSDLWSDENSSPSAGPTRAVRCSMTLWKKLALFAILATFVIFVYLAMETNSVSPFQASDSKSFAM